MKFICDTREQKPWDCPKGHEMARVMLPHGDYSMEDFEHRCVVERKSLDDLIGSAFGSWNRWSARLAELSQVERACVEIRNELNDVGIRCRAEKRMENNLHDEVSELHEAWRNNKLNDPCDKAEKMAAAGLPPLTCKEEENADIVIRVLDNCRHLGIDIARAIEIKHSFNATRERRHFRFS